MRTEIIVVLDRSGSMQRVQEAAVDGFKTFISQQAMSLASSPGSAINVSLYTFSDDVKAEFEGIPVQEVVVPRIVSMGNTALMDAIGVAIGKNRARFAEDKPDAVILLIITDGEENSSKEIRRDACKSLIAQVKEEGWTVNFMCSEESTMKWSQDLGAHALRVDLLNSAGTRASFAAASAGVTQYRSAFLSADAPTRGVMRGASIVSAANYAEALKSFGDSDQSSSVNPRSPVATPAVARGSYPTNWNQAVPVTPAAFFVPPRPAPVPIDSVDDDEPQK